MVKVEQKEVNVYVVTLDRDALAKVGYWSGRLGKPPAEVVAQIIENGLGAKQE